LSKEVLKIRVGQAGITERIDTNINVGHSTNQTGKFPEVSFEALCYWKEVKIIALPKKPIPGGVHHRHITHDGLPDNTRVFTDKLTPHPTA
jgi:hypothetical protein